MKHLALLAPTPASLLAFSGVLVVPDLCANGRHAGGYRSAPAVPTGAVRTGTELQSLIQDKSLAGLGGRSAASSQQQAPYWRRLETNTAGVTVILAGGVAVYGNASQRKDDGCQQVLQGHHRIASARIVGIIPDLLRSSRRPGGRTKSRRRRGLRCVVPRPVCMRMCAQALGYGGIQPDRGGPQPVTPRASRRTAWGGTPKPRRKASRMWRRSRNPVSLATTSREWRLCSIIRRAASRRSPSMALAGE